MPELSEIEELYQTVTAPVSLELHWTLGYLMQGWRPQHLEKQAKRLSSLRGSHWHLWDETSLAQSYAGPLSGDLTVDLSSFPHGPSEPQPDPILAAAQAEAENQPSPEGDAAEGTDIPRGETSISFYPDVSYGRLMSEEWFYDDGSVLKLEYGVDPRPEPDSFFFQFSYRGEKLVLRHSSTAFRAAMWPIQVNEPDKVAYTDTHGVHNAALTRRFEVFSQALSHCLPHLVARREGRRSL